MAELMLTDDEVLAVAADERDAWPVELPTVDTGRAPDLREAVWRGRRSLAVRGLLTTDGTPDGSGDRGPGGGDAAADDAEGLLASVRRDVVGAPVLLGLHVGGAAGGRATATFVVNAYPCGADWLVETVSDHGVHGFRHRAHDAVVADLAHLATQAHRHGVVDGSGLARLWIGVVAEGRRPALRVSAGRAAVVDVEAGRVAARTAREVTDLAAEVGRLALDVRALAALGQVAVGSE